MAKLKIASLLIGVIVLSALGVYFFNNNFKDNPTPSNSETAFSLQRDAIIFHELDYTSSSADFVELLAIKQGSFTYTNLSLNISSTDSLKLPTLTNVKYFTFIVIYFSSGSNDTDGNDHLIQIYLNIGTDTLQNSGALFLIQEKTGSSTIILDFIKWGGLTDNFIINNNEYLWQKNDNGPSALIGESIQLFGTTTGSSRNWLSAKPTPDMRNALQFSIQNLNLDIVIENGASELGSQIQVDKPRWNGSIRYWNKTGKPVDAVVATQVKEMVNYTAQYYKQKGFPSPSSRNGTIHVVLENSTDRASTGSSGGGVITVSVGKNWNKMELKLTVEHEMMHLVQWHKSKNSANETITNMPDPASKNNWWEEGMAEYWGVRSAMANYNVTMGAIQNATRLVGSANWYQFGRDLNLSTFSNWGYSWNDYSMAFLFIKYLMETYGLKKVKEIHTGAEDNANATKTVSAQQSLEKVLGKSFNDVLRDYYSWRTFNREDGELPHVFVNYNFTVGSTNSSAPLDNQTQTETTPEGGALVQTVIFNGTRPVFVNFTPSDLGNWSIDAEVTLKNGTVYHIPYSNFNKNTGLWYKVDVAQVSKITFVKLRHIGSNSTKLNISINEIPVTNTSHSAPERISILQIVNRLVNDAYWAIINLTLNTSYFLHITLFNFSIPASSDAQIGLFIHNLDNITNIVFNTTIKGYTPISKFFDLPNLTSSGDYLVELRPLTTQVYQFELEIG